MIFIKFIFYYREIEKGKYSTTDTFAHYDVIIEKHEVILLSDHRILYLVKNDFFGGWQVEWTYRWAEIKTIQSLDQGVQIVLESKENKKVLGLFGSSSTIKKIILVPHKARRDMLAKLMTDLKNISEFN